jgi:hypothetical protein
MQKQYRELILEAPDLSSMWVQIQENARAKHNIYPYDPFKQNSNTLADSVLKDLGLPQAQQDGIFEHWAAASHYDLDINLEPENVKQQNMIQNILHLISEAEQKATKMLVNMPTGEILKSVTPTAESVTNVADVTSKIKALLAKKEEVLAEHKEQISLSQNFGISPALKAQLDEEMQQKNQQSQGRSLG